MRTSSRQHVRSRSLFPTVCHEPRALTTVIAKSRNAIACSRLILVALAAGIMSVPIAASVKAEDTTVIHKDDGYGSRKTIIKKHDDRTYVAPREEKKVIIHHDD
jgi:hypothetical protein